MNIQIGHDAALAESKKKLISGTYLRNAWYVAAWSEAVGDGGVLGLTILKEPVVLYRQSNGEVAALADRCAHRFAPLSMGHIVGGNRIQCPYHGLEYDKTGVCVLNPHGNKNIPSRARVKSYPVIEKHKAFPRRVNAHWVHVHNRGEVTMRTWERGSGITLACGTGACAVCVAGVLTGRTARKLLAHLPGGDLTLEWRESDNHVYMTGSAMEVFSGEWSPPD